MNLEEVEKSLNSLDKEVTYVFLGVADKLKRRIEPPKSANLNEAVLTHQMWRIANRGVKTKRCFRDRLNQIAKKLN